MDSHREKETNSRGNLYQQYFRREARICKELPKFNVKETKLPINKWANKMNGRVSRKEV